MIKNKNYLILFGCLLVIGLFEVIFRHTHNLPVSEPLKKAAIVESVYAIGTVMSHHIFQIKSVLPSVVDELFVKEGDFVQKDAPLVCLESIGIIRAPFAGNITYLPANQSEIIVPNTLLLKLVDLSDRYLLATVDQRGAIFVKPHQTVRISFDNMRSDYYTGVVESLYSEEDTFKVRIHTDSLPDNILPGMTGDMAIIIRENPNALLIPLRAISDNTVEVKTWYGSKTVPVQMGIIDGDVGEVVSGHLSPGDRLYFLMKDPS